MSHRNSLSLRLLLGVSPVVAGLWLTQACANRADDCHYNSNCPMEGGTANAGTAGQGGSGATTGGSSSGDAGNNSPGGTPMTGGGGAMAGDGGSSLGGEGGTPSQPCDGACTAPTPVCKEATDTCVECLAPTDCAAGDENLCDITSNTCVDCLAPADCSTATASRCEEGACAPCEDNTDCAHIAGKGVCDTIAGECVQCTGTDYASCGMDAGTPLVCDSLTRTCTTNKQASSGLCQPCVSDAQCTAGKLCVMETFGTQNAEVGYFCFSQQGAAGSPTDCAATGRPYVDTLVNQTSIDGATGDICGLRVSTCLARNQFSSKDCATSNAPDDSKCGFAPGEDSKCVQFSSTQYRCTTTCLSNDDCDGSVTCDLGAAPKVCEL